MSKLVNLTIDGKHIQAPEGMLVVNAAKMVGVDIPVFCYHPKMEPAGMCRMCLVEIGCPEIDRATGQAVLLPDGAPKISFGPKLETACTTPVSEGMVVQGMTEKAKRGRKDILEFLLTSHPLDCPVCDKGGECPLQNLTLAFGPGESRYIYEEKMHLAKHVPLGELIFLDRERCIQCGRCVRFQEQLAGDPVLGFYNRGRAIEIATSSEPGFDSYFSGNTTDICPVGALTTADFRFKARPWEMNASASICTQCPVGCNITFNTRREAASGGGFAIKRVMPRQNEWVNEIWLCDKGRFGYHYAQSPERLTQPLARRNGQLTPVSWDDALNLVASQFRQAGDGLLTLVSGRLSNEDLFNLRQLTAHLGGKPVLYSHMAGGDLTAQVGLGSGSNFGEMGKETVILVVASDLAEEAPLWRLRVKRAADRGATVIVAGGRETKLERAAKHVLRYPYASETSLVLAMLNTLSAKRPDLPPVAQDLVRDPAVQQAAKIFAEAENAVILFGSDGTSLESSRALAQVCANLLIATNHVGRPNNGLVGVWQRANDQGAWDMDFRPTPDLKEAMKAAKALYVVGVDPAGDDLELAEAASFLVVQDLFLTSTAKLADVVLPALAFTEREGTYTSAERRVQRFYPAVPVRPGVLADFTITAKIAELLGVKLEIYAAARVMDQIAAGLQDYQDVSYTKLAQVVEQWPIVGRGDVYYGGTTYQNSLGLGIQLLPAAQRGVPAALGWVQPKEVGIPPRGLLAVPVNRLYDRGVTLLPSELLHQRIPEPCIYMNPVDIKRLRIQGNGPVEISLNSYALPVYGGPTPDFSVVAVCPDERVPLQVVLAPRSMGIAIQGPTPVEVRAFEHARV